jgi:hypothetical protein
MMNPKIKKALQDPYFACELVLNRLARFIDDEHFVRWKYYLNFRKKLDLDNPQTFNEKLQWLKLNDRHEEYTQMVDKYEAKKYVANLIGEEYIIPTLGVYDSFDEIDFDKLPNQFVLKCTHNSGGIIICRDKASLDVPKARKQMTKWLKKNPFWTNREYPYKHVKPRIIAEQYMEQEDGESLRDYKVLCFNGKAKLIELHRFRYTERQTQDFYDTEWNKTTISQGGGFIDASDKLYPKPDNLDKMILLSETLCADMIHCRADWYSIKGQLYFGEITFFDGSGLDAFDNMDDDFLLGSWIKLPK